MMRYDRPICVEECTWMELLPTHGTYRFERNPDMDLLAQGRDFFINHLYSVQVRFSTSEKVVNFLGTLSIDTQLCYSQTNYVLGS